MPSIFDTLKSRGYALTIDQLFSLKIPEVDVLTICNHGSLRSFDVALELSQCHKIPSLYLEGGLYQISRHSSAEQQTLLQIISRRFQYPVAILVTEEKMQYNPQTTQIPQIRHYHTIDEALDLLPQLLK